MKKFLSWLFHIHSWSDAKIAFDVVYRKCTHPKCQALKGKEFGQPVIYNWEYSLWDNPNKKSFLNQ